LLFFASYGEKANACDEKTQTTSQTGDFTVGIMD